jgi:hypothetical protein
MSAAIVRAGIAETGVCATAGAPKTKARKTLNENDGKRGMLIKVKKRSAPNFARLARG